MSVRIFPPEEMLDATVSLPLSKSISTRALIMAYLTPGVGTLPVEGIAQCTDTAVLRHCLENKGEQLNVGLAGTSMRFLTALFASVPGREVVLDGSQRMRERPIAPLVDALRSMGAKIEYVEKVGFPPLRISGRQLAGGDVTLDARGSSQFASALMMIAPTMLNPLCIKLTDEDSQEMSPYIRMTARMMSQRGVEVEIEANVIKAANTPYTRLFQDAEPDWSAATFWYEIAAVSAGFVTIRDLKSDALQGDRGVEKIYGKLGVATEYDDEGAQLSALPDLYARLDADMSSMPDAVPAVAVTAALIGIPFRLSGVYNLRHKESNRLEVLRSELLKLGIILETEEESGPDVLAWEGRRAQVRELPVIDPHDDHRIAMSFAAAGIFIPGIVIEHSGVVEKSYPGFWEDLRKAGFIIQAADAPFPLQYMESEE